MGVTRAFLRRMIGIQTRQMFVVIATSAGTQSTFIDSLSLSDPTGSLAGRIGIVTGGTAANLGSMFRVTTNSSSATSITLTPSLPSATAVGDECELWNELDQGVTPREVHDLITFAIDTVAMDNPTPVVDDSQTFDRESPVLSLPSTWRWFEGADWEDVNDVWSPVPQQYLRVHPADRTVTILEPLASRADTYSVRLRGATKPSALTTDSAETEINANYIINQCCYLIYSSISNTSMDGQAAERKASDFKANRDAARAEAFTRPRGMGIVIPAG